MYRIDIGIAIDGVGMIVVVYRFEVCKDFVSNGFKIFISYKSHIIKNKPILHIKALTICRCFYKLDLFVYGDNICHIHTAIVGQKELQGILFYGLFKDVV